MPPVSSKMLPDLRTGVYMRYSVCKLNCFKIKGAHWWETLSHPPHQSFVRFGETGLKVTLSNNSRVIPSPEVLLPLFQMPNSSHSQPPPKNFAWWMYLSLGKCACPALGCLVGFHFKEVISAVIHLGSGND